MPKDNNVALNRAIEEAVTRLPQPKRGTVVLKCELDETLYAFRDADGFFGVATIQNYKNTESDFTTLAGVKLYIIIKKTIFSIN